MISTDWSSHAQHLADRLRDSGDIASPAWYAAVAGVPRHVFVPRAYEQDRTGRWVSWSTDERWDEVYAPRTLVTALDDRRGFPEPASSSTNPELMVRMLEMLGVDDGHRVLEIGTGTGYNAALLSHRLGDANVFSVDVDRRLVQLAAGRLGELGYRPTLVATDGSRGLPDHAPYDRVIGTCSVPAVPVSWVEQLAPGGALLVDLKLAISAGNLVHLHRREDGTLHGRFSARWASFMAMRRDGDRCPSVTSTKQVTDQRVHRTEVPLPPWGSRVLWFLAQLCGLPRHVRFGSLLDPVGRHPYAVDLAHSNGSWARAALDDHTVTQAGDVSLWAPIERAHQIWTANGRPGWERLGLSVDTDGHNTVWLDHLQGDHTWSLPRDTPT